MSANTAPILPVMGTFPPAQAVVNANPRPWGYNGMACIVVHETAACPMCDLWALHYMSCVLRKDPTLTDAETQQEEAIRGDLTTEATTLHNNNTSLRSELSAVHKELDTTCRKLASADDEVFRLHDEINAINNDMDATINGLRDKVRNLEHQLWDYKLGQGLCIRKVPRQGSPTPPPDYSCQGSRWLSALPVTAASGGPSMHPTVAAPCLLSWISMLPTAASSSSSILLVELPSTSPVAPPFLEAGDLALHMTNVLPAIPSILLSTTPWAGNLSFCSLLPVLYYGIVNSLAAMPGSIRLDAHGNVDFKAHTFFVLASGGVYNGQPSWHTTLMPGVCFITPEVLNARAAHLPVPLLNIPLGGSNGILILPDDLSTEIQVHRLLGPAKNHCKVAAYIERVKWTPPELRDAIHQHVLDHWPGIINSRHRANIPLQLEPLPWDDDSDWRKWLKEVWDHPQLGATFKYIGIPHVGGGYLSAHLTGMKALLLFLLLTFKGTAISSDY